MKGQVLGIRILEWHMDGKSGNWVSEVFASDASFVPKTGETKVTMGSPLDSALSRNARAQYDKVDDFVL